MAIYTNINRNNNNKTSRPTRTFPAKTVGYVLTGIGVIGTIAMFTNLLGFLHYFIMGTFGIFSYALLSGNFIIARALIKGKKFVVTKKYVVYLLIALLSFLTILQMAFLGATTATSFGEYLADIYSLQTSLGGVVIGLLSYPLLSFLNPVGAYIVCIILLSVFSALIIDYLTTTKTFNKFTSHKLNNFNEQPKKKEQHFQKINKKEKQRLKNKEPINITLNAQQEKARIAKEEALYKLGLGNIRNNRIISEQEITAPTANYVNNSAFTPMFEEKKVAQKHVRPERIIHNDYNNITTTKSNKHYSLGDNEEQNKQFLRATIPTRSQTNNVIKGVKNNLPNPNKEFSTNSLTNKINSRLDKLKENNLKKSISNEMIVEDVDSKFEQDLKNLKQVTTPVPNQKSSFSVDPIIPNKNINKKSDIATSSPFGYKQMELAGTEIKNEKTSKPRYRKPSRYVRPPVELLNTISTMQEDYDEEYIEKSRLLEKVLNDFKVPAKVINVTKGPAVTRYELQMPAGISVKKITQHAEDIAMTLASNGAVRIEAPIPGKNAVGVEVPNSQIATIALRDIIDSKEFAKSNSTLTFGLGKDISGSAKVCDLARMPHLLVAGATGSGKSVCLNSLIISLLYKSSPEDLRLILIDPKRVEFYVYNGLPHLMLPNVVTDSAKALNALNWAIGEMEKRFELFQTARVKNLAEYNDQPEIISGTKPKIPMIVIIVDELADLIMTNKREVEDKIMRLAQKARAAGIHLVLATQRPSVDVITGTIKANLPSRIAFSVTSIADSKTILDGGGAEKLLGKGDMLYAPLDYPESRRIQGAFVSNNEVKSIVDYIKQNNEAYFDEEATQKIMAKIQPNAFNGNNSNEFDSIFPQALKLIIETGQASISMLQRRFSVGFNRAARVIDQMETAKYISPSDGSKSRKVYLTMEKYNELFGE